ncbi:MAG: hypothetical protein JO061_02495 [Acidobacteriaceae bacterium]|nr:hypothetical protein [Acidobacteriaceae bacterium]
MKDRRVLMFAYHFPPENSVGGARPFRFYKYLGRLGYKCRVITAADVSSRPDLDAECIPDPFVGTEGQDLGFQVERAIRKALLPGVTGVQWAMHAYESGLRFVKTHADDEVTIFSSFPPLGVHIAAHRLVRTTGLPWIADYRDPLGDNPINDRLGRHTRLTYSWLERVFMDSAARTVANTDEAEAVLKRKFASDDSKIHLIWNGFDPEERLSAAPVAEGSRKLLTHIGELYQGRTAAPILESLERLFATGTVSSSCIQVCLVGGVEPTCLPPPEFVQRAETAGWLSVTPYAIPKCEAQGLAQRSEGLLLVQPQSAIQVPGKLFEYLQIGRPILAFVPRRSAIERLLSKTGVPFHCVYPDMGAEAFDETVLNFLSLRSDPVPPGAWFEESFNAVSQAEELADLIEQCWRDRR